MADSQSIRELRRYAAAIINAETESSLHSHAPLPVSGPSPRRLRLPARVGLVAAVLVAGNIGLAVASDSAIPGDFLYPVDRGYEAVAGAIGIDTNESQERIDEAYLLLAHGEPDAAVATAAKALPDAAPEQVKALDELAAELESSETGNSARVHEAVAGLLDAVHRVADDSQTEPDRSRDKTEVQQQARAVAEAARGRPFDPGQGPGSSGDLPQNGDSPANDRTTGDPNGGKGPEDNPGRGNANRESNSSQGAGNGANPPGQGRGNGSGDR